MFTLFFFNDTATTEIYTLSLHDALPISPTGRDISDCRRNCGCRALYDRSSGGPSLPGCCGDESGRTGEDRKSTRLNSSHGYISYAVFCLKKKKSVDSHASATSDTHARGC